MFTVQYITWSKTCTTWTGRWYSPVLFIVCSENGTHLTQFIGWARKAALEQKLMAGREASGSVELTSKFSWSQMVSAIV